MNRRTFLKALAAVAVSPSILSRNTVGLETKKEKPKGDRLIEAKLTPLTNMGVDDDTVLCGYEESLRYEYNLYSVDAKGEKTFLKTLSDREYSKLSKIIQ